ncbi:MAG: hypothetical protein ACREFO_01590, partial [Acetobacteraceae bacterium]
MRSLIPLPHDAGRLGALSRRRFVRFALDWTAARIDFEAEEPSEIRALQRPPRGRRPARRRCRLRRGKQLLLVHIPQAEEEL